MYDYTWLYIIISSLVSGLVGGLIGKNKGMGGLGFVLGAFLGFIGWIIVALLKGEERNVGVSSPAPPPMPTYTSPPASRTSVATRLSPVPSRSISDPSTREKTRLYSQERGVPAAGWLYGLSGSSRGRQFKLSQGDNEIGRSSSCSISLNDSELSRRHCLIRISEGRSILYDLASANGTYLNGELMLEPSVLYDGDEILIGETKLQYKQAG